LKLFSKKLIFPLIIIILGSSIPIISSFNSKVRYFNNVEKGESLVTQYSCLDIRGSYQDHILWKFNSTTQITVLHTSEWQIGIVHEYYPSIDIEGLFIVLHNCIISDGKFSDKGIIKSGGNGVDILLFKPKSSGKLSYRVEFDPFEINYLYIVFGIFILLTFLAIPFYINKFRKILFRKNLKISIVQPVMLRSCRKCGTTLESDSCYCHECGLKLK
jgi:hypothetical protein